MTYTSSHEGSNKIQLHIEQDTLTIDQFVSSIDAFTKMIKELAKSVSDSITWRMSVESGSTCINAELVSEDEEAYPDVATAYRVIEEGVFALTSGIGAENVPELARKHYIGLVNAVGRTGDGLAAGKLVLAYDSANRRELQVETHEEVAPRPSPTYTVIGSVTGVLYNMNSKRGNKFTITNEETGLTVNGSYDDSLLDGFRRAFKTRATVSGILECAQDGRVKSIKANAVSIEPTNVPKLSSLRGILEA